MSLETVTVGCKLPNGLHLDLDSPEGKKRVTLKGANHSVVVGGFGITENVPKDFFEEWARQHSKSIVIASGIVFAYKDSKGAEAIAKERKALKTGFEPLDPEKPGKHLKPDRAMMN
jgi:hypothetical protein